MAGRGRGRGRSRRHVEPPEVTPAQLEAWFAGNLPDDWFTEPVVVKFDRDELIVTGELATPKLDADGDAAAAAQARIAAFRESTRGERMEIAERAQALFLRRVSWAATCGDQSVSFTTANVPVMTRLSMEERTVLDTLIDAGVARSRSDAVGWCVQLVAENESEWIDKLRDAMEGLTEIRDQGPESRD